MSCSLWLSDETKQTQSRNKCRLNTNLNDSFCKIAHNVSKIKVQPKTLIKPGYFGSLTVGTFT